MTPIEAGQVQEHPHEEENQVIVHMHNGCGKFDCPGGPQRIVCSACDCNPAPVKLCFA